MMMMVRTDAMHNIVVARDIIEHRRAVLLLLLNRERAAIQPD